MKNFDSFRSNFMLNALLDFEPVKIFENWSEMSEFGSFRNSHVMGDLLNSSVFLALDIGSGRFDNLR